MTETGSSLRSPGHQDALDGVRAIAALVVLLFHVATESGTALLPGFWPSLLSRGDIGVSIFFVLSGLLLYRPWATAALHGGPRPDTRVYLWRRALRVLPAYWLVLITAMLLWSGEHLADLGGWLKLITLTHIYPTDNWWKGLGPPALPQMWSLSVEIAFYLALPLLALGLHRLAGRADGPDGRARRLLAALAALSALSFAWTALTFYPDYRPQLTAWPPRSAIYFCAGMALAVTAAWAGENARTARFCRGVAASSGSLLIVLALAYAIAATPLTGSRFFGVDSVWAGQAELLLYTVIALCLVAPLALWPAARTPLARFLGSPVMRYLGQISYGVFLWQFVAIIAWWRLTGQQPWNGGFLVNLAAVTLITVALAALTHRFLETPVRRLNRLVRPRRAASPAPRP